MNQSIHLLYKKRGETPLVALERLRQKEDIDPSVSMTYAGRLDPAAEGLLIILSGDEVYKKEEYLGLPKTYVVDVLFDVSTDTGDLLGLVEEVRDVDISKKNIETILPTFLGTRTQEYPNYSSKKTEGKQLWQHAREGSEVKEMPSREVEIYSIEMLDFYPLRLKTKGADQCLSCEIKELVESIAGDFRQKEILKRWEETYEKLPENLNIAKIRVSASGGTYMRVLVQDIAEKLGTVACAKNIKRIKIGKFVLE